MDNWDWYTAHKYEAPVNTPKPLPVQKVWYEERIAALESEIEALRKDADRWRILRKQTGAHKTLAYAFMFHLPQWIAASTNVNLLKGSVAEHLDNAADLARKEAGNG